MNKRKIIILSILSIFLAGCSSKDKIEDTKQITLPIQQQNTENPSNEISIFHGTFHEIPGSNRNNCRINKKDIICDEQIIKKSYPLNLLATSLSGRNFQMKDIAIFTQEESGDLSATLNSTTFLFNKNFITTGTISRKELSNLSLFSPFGGLLTSDKQQNIDNIYVRDNSITNITTIVPNPLITKAIIQRKDQKQEIKLINFTDISSSRVRNEGNGNFIGEDTSITFPIQKKTNFSISLYQQSNKKTTTLSYTLTTSGIIVKLPEIEKNNNYLILIEYKQGDTNYTTKLIFDTNTFEIINQKQLSKNGIPTNNIELCGTHPINIEILQRSLEEALGSGKITTFEKKYQRRNGFDDSPNKNCAVISYFLAPVSNEKKTIKISSIYGVEKTIDIEFPRFEFLEENKEDRFVKFGANSVSILPKTKTDPKVQIVSKNIPNPKFTIEKCNRTQDPVILTQQIEKDKIKQDSAQGDYYALNRFLNCTGTYTKTISVTNFQRRKTSYQDINLKSLFSGDIPNIIHISKDAEQRGQIYMLSNIGFLSKWSSQEKRLNVWVNDLDTGKPYKDLEYTLGTYLNRKRTIQTGTLNSFTSFTLEKEPEIGFLYVKNNDKTQEGMLLFPNQSFKTGPTQTNYAINPFYIPSYEIGGQEYLPDSPYSIYAFTDRALYKPNKERIFVSGWIRKQSKSTTPKGNLNIEVTDPQGNNVYQETINKLDSFGGFKTDFTLPEHSVLGTYTIRYLFENTVLKGQSPIFFSSFFEVQEVKKSNIANNIKRQESDGYPTINIQPKYYFGGALNQYTVKAEYSVKTKNEPIYNREFCGRRGCDEFMYYENGESESQSGGNITLENIKNQSLALQFPVKTKRTLDIQGTIVVIDKKTQEVKESSFFQRILPKKMIGIIGEPYERIGYTEKPTYTIKGVIQERKNDKEDGLKNYSPVSKKENIIIDVFQQIEIRNQEQSTDGERYYSSKTEDKLLKTYKTATQEEGKYSYDLQFPTTGNYKIVVYTNDGYKNIKIVQISDYTNDSYEGTLPNNYVLGIQTKNKEYNVGEQLEVKLDPAIPGATAIITIEKEGKILFNKSVIVTKEPIQLKVDKSRFPNAWISIAQIVPTEINTKLNKHTENPRVLLGYKNILLKPSEMKLDININISNLSGKQQVFYAPGQDIQIDITSKTPSNKTIQSRVSVGIVDKAIIDIYDQIKTPLLTFYTLVNPGFKIFTNYHLIYKTLKVFTSNGEKGGDGDDGGTSLLQALLPRKKFLDVAYRNGGEITDTKGKLHLKTKLPDNLTTWVVEVIGVSTEGHMGSERIYFTTNKEVQVIAAVPRFLQPGGTITIPLSIITQKTGGVIPLKANLVIGKQIIPLTIEENKGNKIVRINSENRPIETLSSISEATLQVRAGNYDSIEYILPIRKEGVVRHIFSLLDSTKKTTTLELGNKVREAKITVHASRIPTSIIQEYAEQLIGYSYGCTEQSISTLNGAALLLRLQKQYNIKSTLLSGDKIAIYNQDTNTKERKTLQEIISKTIQLLKEKQSNIGLLGSWNKNYQDNLASIYAYTTLKKLSSSYTIDKQFLNQLEQGLNTITNPQEQMYLLMNYSKIGKTISINKVDELLKSNPTLATKIMAYVAKTYQKKEDKKLKEDIVSALDIPNSYQYNPDMYLITRETILSYFIDALLEQKETQQAEKYILQLMKTANINQFFDTHKSRIQAQTRERYFKEISFPNEEQTVSLKINENPITIKIPKDTNLIEKTLIEKNKNTILIENEKISKGSFITVSVEYLPEKEPNEELHASTIESNISLKQINKTEIGDIVTIASNFSVKQDSRNLAVMLNIPSFTYILNPIQQETENFPWDNQKQKAINFITKGGSNTRFSCVPDHYEVRFDRLFLYYKHLPAGATCEINFKLIKSHQGEIPYITHRIFEMYNTQVRGETTK